MADIDWSGRHVVDLAPKVGDETRTTTCYMCACRCGIKVHLKDGKVRYIEGNREHPVNRGVLCAKGSAGIMQHNSPARLTAPLLRVGERGEGRFEEISWERALDLATQWMAEIRADDPKKLAFFTGRDQSQSLTGWWAAQFGTPNFAAHGGFCSVNMAAAGLYTIGGSFWEFGEIDWDLTRYFMMFGVAEDHDSNPIKIGLGKLKTRGAAKFVSVNPVRTGYSAIADEWLPVNPGHDGLFVLALVHCLLEADRVDLDFLARYTNAHWLVVDAPGTAGHGLFARNAEGKPLCVDAATGDLADATRADVAPRLAGDVKLPDGRRARPVLHLIAERYLDAAYTPESVAEKVGIPAATIRRIAAEIAEAAFEQTVTLPIAWTDWAGRRHESFTGRPVAFHAMRGISAHSNGFHTCRAIHLLQMLVGAIDCPGAYRYKAPYPRQAPPGPRPAGKAVKAGVSLGGMPLGFPFGPEDLLVDEAGEPTRIDKAYSWEHPLAAHGMMHMVLHNAWAGDPYPVDLLFSYMANIGWNSSMNVVETLKYLTDKREDGTYKIPRFIYADAYWSETVAYADLVLPDTTYLERWDCISLLDRPIGSAHGPADAIRQPVVKPDRDVRPFQDVLIELGARLKLPGFAHVDGRPAFPGGYPDYLVNHERGTGIGPLAGWRGADGQSPGRGAPNPDQLARYVENGCFWQQHLPADQQYFKHANRGYLDYAKAMGWMPAADQIVLQLYSEPMQKFRLAAEGHGAHQPPDRHRERVRRYFDPLPLWFAPFEFEAAAREGRFRLHAITQRPMQMYHSWGSQNAWLRQITARNFIHVHVDTARDHGLGDGDWAWIVSPFGRVKGEVKTMTGVNRNTVWTWNAIGKRRNAWGLDRDAPEATEGFLLNHIITETLPLPEGGRISNSDPVTGQAAWFDLRVTLEKCAPAEAGETAPDFVALPPAPLASGEPRVLRYGADIHDRAAGTAPAPAPIEWVGNRAGYAAQGVLPAGRREQAVGRRE